jgi:biopolymer transport protein ExbD
MASHPCPFPARVKGMGQAISLLGADARPRRYGFALTPLADAMFQLLIFFMLSSSLSPYSLIALTGGAPAGQSPITGTADPRAAVPDAGDVMIWQLSRGELRAGDRVLALAELEALIPALKAVPEVLILPTRSARVQDIATVLEALGRAGVGRVRLVAGSQMEGN